MEKVLSAQSSHPKDIGVSTAQHGFFNAAERERMKKKKRAAVRERVVASGAALLGLSNHGDRLFEMNSLNSFKNLSP